MRVGVTVQTSYGLLLCRGVKILYDIHILVCWVAHFAFVGAEHGSIPPQ
jgi:hypothetical protein